MATTFVYTYCQSGISLADACRIASQLGPGESPVAILYSPQKCSMARLSGGTLLDCTNAPIDMSCVYEARVFCSSLELRWLNDPSPSAQHRAVILAEKDFGNSLNDSWHKERKEVLYCQEQTYLLWGQVIKSLGDGWSQVGGARIGAMEIPVANVAPGENVFLKSVEYFVERDYGNVVVWAERLRGF